jgi:predicted GNAT family acetyltransferase
VRVFNAGDEDEMLVAEVEDQLRGQGLGDDEIEFTIASMRDEGVFRCY